MQSSIQEKINRSIQALNVQSIERLLANIQVIEGYIERKPVFLEWLHAQVFVDEQGHPAGFSARFNSTNASTVKVWLLAMYAQCGDMVLQGIERLDLSMFENVYFPKQMNECFTLSVLHLPMGFEGIIPRSDVCWIYSKDLHRISKERFVTSKWVVVLTGPPCYCVRHLPLHQFIGVDAAKVSESVFTQWCEVLQAAPIEIIDIPSDCTDVGVLPDWHRTLKVVSATPASSMFSDHTQAQKILNVEMLYLSNWNNRRSQATSFGFSDFPEALMLLQNLRWLDISRNPIQHFPEDITALRRLKVLNIANTDLHEFPKQLIQLMNLERLFIRNTNAAKTREWLNILTERNTNISVRRVVNEEKINLWCLYNQYNRMCCNSL